MKEALETISKELNMSTLELVSTLELEKVIRFAIAKENEECAAIADQHSSPLVASKIRARLKEQPQ